MNKNVFKNLFFLIALLLLNASCASANSQFIHPIQIELDIPTELENDFQQYNDLIDMGDVCIQN